MDDDLRYSLTLLRVLNEFLLKYLSGLFEYKKTY